MAAPARSPRRTQEERSRTTQRRILDAALDCLAAEGYASMTTLAVAARAGVSRGAQLHHFPTRAALVSAAVQHLFDGLREDYERAFRPRALAAGRIRAAIALLWKSFQDVRLSAVLDLYVAARTDAELAAALLPVSDVHNAHVLALARAYFPEAAADPDRLEATLDLVIDTLQGMAVRRLLRPDDKSIPRTLAALESAATAALSS